MAECLPQDKRFFCREWVFSKLQHYLDTRFCSKTCGVLIMGGPGSGKTAICCQLSWPTAETGKQVWLNKRLLAFHFCQAHNVSSLSLSTFIRGIVQQTCRTNLIPGYKDKLTDAHIQSLLHPVECERHPDEAFKQAFIHPIQNCKAPASNVIMLVDSVDQTCIRAINDATNSGTIADLLAAHHAMFPQWLLLVCTCTTRSRSVTKMFTGFRKIVLDDLRKSYIVRDVQQYILCRLDLEEKLRRHMSRDTAEMLNQLHIKCYGCFLYLEKVLDGIAENFILLREIRDIPGTLNGLYLWLCQRLFPRDLFRQIQPIINVLLASFSTPTLDTIHHCLLTRDQNLTRVEFDSCINQMSKILTDETEGKKMLFHYSFADWLLDVKHCTQKFLCSAEDGHSMLAMHSMMNASSLMGSEIQEMVLHLIRASFSPPLQEHHLVQAVLLSGAQVETCFIAMCSIDSRSLKVLLSAGATLPVTYAFNEKGFVEKDISNASNVPVGDQLALNEAGVNGRTVLHVACCSENTNLVTSLISQGFDVNAVDNCGQTSLDVAARQGHASVVSLLLKEGADVDHADHNGWTALRSASWGGHLDIVLNLLAFGARVNYTDNSKRTALRAAAWGGHEDVVVNLLRNGADVNMADNEGRTPLIAAAYMGHAEIVEYLLDHHADINHKDFDGRTSLSLASLCVPASTGHRKVVNLLLNRGAAVNHCDKDGITPLHVAASEGHVDVCEMLLEWESDVDRTDNSGRTPLWAAVLSGRADLVGQLLFWGAAVDTIDNEGRTILSIAASFGHVDVVRLLLNRGLDETHRDHSGWTPLHMAAYDGNEEVCRLLVEQGARVNEVDNVGRQPLHQAAQEGHVDAVGYLLENGARVSHRSHDGKTGFRVACMEGHRSVSELLLSRGSDLNYQDSDDRSTLYVLALDNNVDMSDFLLNNCADSHLSDMEGRSPLHVAAWQGHTDMVTLLLKHHADVNAEDNDRRTPLQSAAWQGHGDVVCLLLQHGAVIDHACNQGATALCVAAQEGHHDVVRVLLRHEANLNHADKFGRTPMRVAVKAGHQNVINLLEDFGATPMSSCSKPFTSASHSSSDKNSPSTASCSTNPASIKTTTSGLYNNYTKNSHRDSLSTLSPKQVVSNALLQHISSPGSLASMSERWQSFQSNNSSMSSNSITMSTNGSILSAQPRIIKEENCDRMTFTQQLQRCSAEKRHRRLSRVVNTSVGECAWQERYAHISPIAEETRRRSDAPRTNCAERELAVHRPTSNNMESDGMYDVSITGTGRVCVKLGEGVEIMGNRPPSSSITASKSVMNRASWTSFGLKRSQENVSHTSLRFMTSTPRTTSASINITTNPNAEELSTYTTDLLWKRQASLPSNSIADVSRPLPPSDSPGCMSAPALPPRVPLVNCQKKPVVMRPDTVSSEFDVASHFTAKSRYKMNGRKRIGIVTNPKVTRSESSSRSNNVTRDRRGNDELNQRPKSSQSPCNTDRNAARLKTVNGCIAASNGCAKSTEYSGASCSPVCGRDREDSGKANQPTGFPLTQDMSK